MDLPKDYLLLKLMTLRPTEEHLKAFAVFIKTFENQEKVVVEGISYAHSISSIHHRITLYYLVNELFSLQLSIKLKADLKRFINENFTNDIKESLKFEILNKKLLELERVWNKRKILSFGVDPEEIVLKIKESFYDRNKLISVLKEILSDLEKNEK